MTDFVSYSKEIQELLTFIVASPQLHAKWLNTTFLS